MLFKHQIFKSSPFQIELMTFEIVERFQTIVALITGFTKRRTESADLFGVFRPASRTFFGNIQMIFVISLFGRRNSVNAQFFAGFIGDPICGPNWGNS